MIRILGLISILLILNSCQQRYWHVKKVKVPVQEQLLAKKKYHELKTLSSQKPDSLVFSEIVSDFKLDKLEYPKESSQSIQDSVIHHSVKEGKKITVSAQSESSFKKADSKLPPEPKYEPLKFKDFLFIFCAFLFFALLFSFPVLLSIFLALLSLYSGFISMIFLIIIIPLFILSLYLIFSIALKIGKRLSKKHIKNEINPSLFYLSYALALIIALGLTYLYFVLGSIVLIIMAILIALSGIYLLVNLERDIQSQNDQIEIENP